MRAMRSAQTSPVRAPGLPSSARRPARWFAAARGPWRFAAFAVIAGSGFGACGGKVAPAAPSCGRSTSLASAGLDGFERCEDGVVHRAARRTCPSKLPRADVAFPPGPSQNCTRDADCTRSPNGHCALGGLAGPDGMRHTICLYGCMTDADCPAQSICVCADPVGACALAYCGTDADCPAPYLCAESQAGCAATFACQTPEDTCALDADCAADCDGSPCREAGRSCELVAGHLSCQFSACPPSRP